jgi:hypothetical protein
MRHHAVRGWWTDAGTVASLHRAAGLVAAERDNPVLARSRRPHEVPRHGRRRLHRLQLRALSPRRAPGRGGREPRRTDLRRTPREPRATSRIDPRHRSSTGTSATRDVVREVHGRAATSSSTWRPSRTSTARSSRTPRSCGRTCSARPRCWPPRWRPGSSASCRCRPTRCTGSCRGATRRAARRRTRRAQVHRGHAARSALSLLGQQGRRGPPRPGLPHDARPRRRRSRAARTTTGRISSPRSSSRDHSRARCG